MKATCTKQFQDKLGLTVLNALCRDKHGENIVLSPLSMRVALAIAANGSRAETRNELFSLLNQKPGLSKRHTNERLSGQLAASKNSEEVHFELANGLVSCTGLEFKKQFLNTVTAFYGTSVQQLDPCDPAALILLNSVLCRKTRGQVASIVEEFDCCPEQELYLLNAAYLKGRLQAGFNPLLTQLEEFALLDGSSVSCALMHAKGNFSFASNSVCQFLRLPYGESERFSLQLFLPNERGAKGLCDLESSWQDPGFMQQLNFDAAESKQGSVYLPRFRVQQAIKLDQLLQKTELCPNLVYTPDLASLARCKCGLAPRIQIRQKAVFELDEEAWQVGNPNKELDGKEEFSFRADRPFYFLVVDQDYGTICMAGLMLNPQAARCRFSSSLSL